MPPTESIEPSADAPELSDIPVSLFPGRKTTFRERPSTAKPAAPAPAAAPASAAEPVTAAGVEATKPEDKPAPAEPVVAAVAEATKPDVKPDAVVAPVVEAAAPDVVATPEVPAPKVETAPISKALTEAARVERVRKAEARKAEAASKAAADREAAATAREAAAATVQAEATALKARFEAAKGNPKAMLALSEEFGVPYAEVMKAGLDLTPEQKAAAEAAKKTADLDSRLTATEREAKAEIATLKQQIAERDAAAAEATVRQFNAGVVAEVKSLASEFPWTTTVGMANDVIKEIHAYAAEHHEILPVREAIAKVEARAKQNADGFLAEVEKNPVAADYIRKRLGVTAPAKPAAPASATKPAATTVAPPRAAEPAAEEKPKPTRRPTVVIDNRSNAATPQPFVPKEGHGLRSKADLERYYTEGKWRKTQA